MLSQRPELGPVGGTEGKVSGSEADDTIYLPQFSVIMHCLGQGEKDK